VLIKDHRSGKFVSYTASDLEFDPANNNRVRIYVALGSHNLYTSGGGYKKYRELWNKKADENIW
jgi:hypothetical protein